MCIRSTKYHWTKTVVLYEYYVAYASVKLNVDEHQNSLHKELDKKPAFWRKRWLLVILSRLRNCKQDMFMWTNLTLIEKLLHMKSFVSMRVPFITMAHGLISFIAVKFIAVPKCVYNEPVTQTNIVFRFISLPQLLPCLNICILRI